MAQPEHDMEVKVPKESFDEMKEGLLNHIISTEEWEPMKGLLFIESGEEQLIAEVLECTNLGQGRFLIVFAPIGSAAPLYDKPVSMALEEVPEPNRSLKPFLESMTKPWHGYKV